MRVIKFILIISSLLIYLKGYSQKEAYNWYFGANAGITFHTSPPTALTDGQMNTWEGCASISSPDGNLLFYTDGTDVWDRNHNLMPNGSGLMGDASSSQSAIAVQWPDSAHLYFIFTVTNEARPNGLRYSVLNLKLNGGNGDIVKTKKNILLKTPVCEKLTAVKQANGHDYWVLATQYGSDSIFSYSITSSGLNMLPTVSNSGLIISTIFQGGSAIGYLKVSPDGKKIAYSNSHMDTSVLGDFDVLTGKVSNVWKFYSKFGYGIEFSPKGKFLYVTEQSNDSLIQYDLSATSLKDFVASKTKVDSMAYPYALQLGPDGKIYISLMYGSYLAVIHAPDSPGVYCRPQHDYVSLKDKNCHLGLPTFVQSFFLKVHPQVSRTCFGDSTTFLITSIGDLDSVRWDFGDPSTGLRNSSKKLQDVHIYSASGQYKVKLMEYYKTYTDSIFQNVNIHQAVNPDLGNDTIICNAFSIKLKLKDNYRYLSYTWMDTMHSDSSILVTKQGDYWLEVLDSNQCKSMDTIKIINPQMKIGFDLSDTIKCLLNNSFEMKDTTKYVNEKWMKSTWCFGDSTFQSDTVVNKVYSISGTYPIKLVVQSQTGCRDSILKKVNVIGLPNGVLYVNNDSQCLVNNQFLFKVNGIPIQGYWDFGDGKKDTSFFSSHQYNSPGSYKVLYFVSSGSLFCSAKDTLNVLVFENPKAQFSFDPGGCRQEFLFINTSKNYAKLHWIIEGQDFFSETVPYQFKSIGKHKVSLILNDSTELCRDTSIIYTDSVLSLKGQLKIPNVFTPGIDNFNDCYQLGGVDAICGDQAEMLIFDRWGIQVYKGDIVKNCWNGKKDNAGDDLPPGVYYFILKLNYYNEIGEAKEIISNGVIQLIR